MEEAQEWLKAPIANAQTNLIKTQQRMKWEVNRKRRVLGTVRKVMRLY